HIKNNRFHKTPSAFRMHSVSIIHDRTALHNKNRPKIWSGLLWNPILFLFLLIAAAVIRILRLVIRGLLFIRTLRPLTAKLLIHLRGDHHSVISDLFRQLGLLYTANDCRDKRNKTYKPAHAK